MPELPWTTTSWPGIVITRELMNCSGATHCSSFCFCNLFQSQSAQDLPGSSMSLCVFCRIHMTEYFIPLLPCTLPLNSSPVPQIFLDNLDRLAPHSCRAVWLEEYLKSKTNEGKDNRWHWSLEVANKPNRF